jgi:hypothetical protein
VFFGSRLSCLRSLKGRCQKQSAINLKLAARVLASSVCVRDEEHGCKKAQRCDSGENIEDWRLETITRGVLDYPA